MRRFLRTIGLLLLAALGALAWSFAPIRLETDPPERWAAPLPPAHPPDGMRLSVIRTGTIVSRHGLAVRGGDLGREAEFEMAPILIEHPLGTLLIDSGFGREVDAQVAALPWLPRHLTTHRRGTPAAETLGSRGVALRGIVLTHAHWDHVSGIPDFPGTNVLVPQAEVDFIASGAQESELIRGFADVAYEVYAFDGGPYLGFPSSHDFFGDGSVVAVPAPGHTPGSVVVFVALPDGARYALIGDLSWTLEGVEWPAERPWLPRTLADADAELARVNLRHMHALMAQHPEVHIVPAHDRRALDALEKREAAAPSQGS